MTADTRSVLLLPEEVRALYQLIADLSGHAPENAFAWDGSDDPMDPAVSAVAKVFLACGQRVPESCRGVPV